MAGKEETSTEQEILELGVGYRAADQPTFFPARLKLHRERGSAERRMGGGLRGRGSRFKNQAGLRAPHGNEDQRVAAIPMSAGISGENARTLIRVKDH